MLTEIKSFYVTGKSIPQIEDWTEAVKIAQTYHCIVDVRWLPNRYAGQYNQYVFESDDPERLNSRTPRTYGV